MIFEELRIKSGIKSIDNSFRNYIKQIFSPSFLKKIDRVLDTSFKLKTFKRSNNVMCYTMGTNIYINPSAMKSLPEEKAINYIFHEMIHAMINTGKFPELNKLQNNLLRLVIRGVPRGKESDFLTGKHQDIHSDWRGEVINYLFNNSINWDIAYSGMKVAYKTLLKESGIFNLDSNWWKKRFGDTEPLERRKNIDVKQRR